MTRAGPEVLGLERVSRGQSTAADRKTYAVVSAGEEVAESWRACWMTSASDGSELDGDASSPTPPDARL